MRYHVQLAYHLTMSAVYYFLQVVNLDMPESAEGYVHRIGRTGRAYSTGASISLVSLLINDHYTINTPMARPTISLFSIISNGRPII